MGSYQDTCKVCLSFMQEINIFCFKLSLKLQKGDSGGGQMCVKSDGRWYVGGLVKILIVYFEI
jgi:hypothetical protein